MQLKLVKKKKSLSAVYISEEIKDFSDQAVNMSAAKLDSFLSPPSSWRPEAIESQWHSVPLANHG